MILASKNCMYSGDVSPMNSDQDLYQLPAGKRSFQHAFKASLILGMLGMLAIPGIAVSQGASKSEDKSSGIQTPAGDGMQFDVASVRLSAPDSRPYTNFGLDSAEDAGRLNGIFRANTSVKAYIEFAYRLPEFEDQEEELLKAFPSWARSTLVAIEARAEGNPTKAEVRRMMQKLLAERLQLKTHYETRTLPVYAVVPVEPGKFGPGLQIHSEGDSCAERSTPQLGDSPKEKSKFCGDSAWVENDQLHLQMRDTTMEHFVVMLTDLGSLQGDTEFRALVDGSGLTGKYDIQLAFRLKARASVDAGPDSGGLTAVEAMKKQLGLKLVKKNAPVKLLVLDHIEKPLEN
jgi:uncharacterized protein (TIGR03435 family)